MSQDEGPDRRYSEAEMALILRKAAQIQPRQGPEGAADPGRTLTLEEIQSIAAEVGMDPGVVARAAALLDVEHPGFLARVFGASRRYSLDATFSGSVSPADLGRILDAIRNVSERPGEASEVLGSLEWQSKGEPSEVSVTVTPRECGTYVRITGNRDVPMALHITFPLTAALVALGVTAGALEPVAGTTVGALAVGYFGGAALLARTLWKRTGRKFHGYLERLMEAVAAVVEENAAAPDERE